MGRLALAGSLAWLAACAPATDETAQEGIGTPEVPVSVDGATGTPVASPADAISAAELPGEYRIAGVDGGDIDLPHAITASIRDSRIRVTAGCVEAAWRYSYGPGGLATTREPVVSCDRGRYPEEEAVFAAFDAAERAARAPSNGIELSGGGHSVTLFSQ